MKRLLGIIGAVVLMAAAAVPGIVGWAAVDPVPMPPQGWMALIVGLIVFAGLGGGLMWLVFYSSRRGYDDRADTTVVSSFEDDDRS